MDAPTSEQIAEWYPRLFRTAMRMTGRHDLAEDMTQEAFCRALKNWEKFNGYSLPTTWLRCILLNCVRDWQRRQSVRRCDPLDEWALPVSNPAGGPHDVLHKREQLQHMREAIQALPSALRPAFVATVLDGYTYKETADMLSVAVGTIASRVYEARKHVQAAMQKAYPEALT
ncbi:hypothetical protein LCGC14_1479120 [marine sediment metagenome]|uniref:HTH luxR-type domain-containing protein n=1 Tax=marine sediment metagenome TaxID=412755 RepID=A0A0F9JA23_9ZZZZ